MRYRNYCRMPPKLLATNLRISSFLQGLLAASRFKNKTPQAFCPRHWGHKGFQFLAKVLGRWWWAVESRVFPWNPRLSPEPNNFLNQTWWNLPASLKRTGRFHPPGFCYMGYTFTIHHSLQALIGETTFESLCNPNKKSAVKMCEHLPQILGCLFWWTKTIICRNYHLEKQQVLKYGQLAAIGDFNQSSKLIRQSSAHHSGWIVPKIDETITYTLYLTLIQ